MIIVVIVQAVVIAGLAAACVVVARSSHSTIENLQQAARAERFELHERIRHPEARPVAVPVRRARPEGEAPIPKDLSEYAKVGQVAPPRDNENGVVS